jgi:hypothetical protein
MQVLIPAADLRMEVVLVCVKIQWEVSAGLPWSQVLHKCLCRHAVDAGRHPAPVDGKGAKHSGAADVLVGINGNMGTSHVMP